MAALGESLEVLRAMVRSSVEGWDITITDSIVRFKTAYPNEESIVGLAAVRKRNKMVDESVPIFSGFIEYRKALQRKNCNLGKLGKRFVSGEAMRKDKE